MLSRWLSVFCSVLCALFGVQSDKKRQHDFQADSPWPYIVVGIIGVALFIVSLLLVVSWVL
ncbi:DUF2970 domain-containing protein [Algibacillus agarilyticus]|uniref:DUF2970 domain-containing protein n=1 Tax=Algibacillus agarilyticus TaxID=2234133 RepID=UPI000DD03719|nr:DUF2970 domain-containing protein [Algibacillus agarilyticus]